MNDPAADPGFKKFLRNLGKRITQLRTEKHWPPAQLAQKSGLSTAKLAQIEAGQADFTMDTMLQFAHVFDMKIAEIFQGADYPPPENNEEPTR